MISSIGQWNGSGLNKVIRDTINENRFGEEATEEKIVEATKLGFQQERTAEPNMSGHCTNRNQRGQRVQTSGVNWATRIPQDGYSKTRVRG